MKIHVYDGEKAVRVKRIDAWPCPSGFELHKNQKPTIVVDNKVNVPFFITEFQGFLDF